MTSEYASEYLKEFFAKLNNNEFGELKPYFHLAEAIDMAIKALEHEPCEDYISRQAVLNTLDSMDKALTEDRTVEEYKEVLEECYKVLPSVQPMRAKGKWGGSHGTNCSQCGYWATFNEGNNCFDLTNFCPNCGAKMIEVQESEDKE